MAGFDDMMVGAGEVVPLEGGSGGGSLSMICGVFWVKCVDDALYRMHGNKFGLVAFRMCLGLGFQAISKCSAMHYGASP